MHRRDEATEQLTRAVLAYALERVEMDPPPLDRARSLVELQAAAGNTITPGGIGGLEALRLFAEVLAPACISEDHPRFWSFVPVAPTESSVLFDLVVGASSIYGGSWMEGAGAIYAENQALRWIADLAGLPPGAGGVFVSGGTAGNLSALVAARHAWRHRSGGAHDRTRGLILCSTGAHSSVAQAARVMDVDVYMVVSDERGRLTREALDDAIASMPDEDRQRLLAVVATAGTTNVGVVDDLTAAADAAEALGTWFHVDGAYGGAALAAPSVRHLFAGVERADSFIVDPHKWLFGPFDSCALLYRDPRIAKVAHTQHAEYLEVLHNDDEEWNASDYAHHLSRRVRGLPLWFSLATHGTDAYTEAIETTLHVAHEAARLIDAAPHLQLLLQPELSVVMFRRVGWTADQYEAWSERMIEAGLMFVVPTAWAGETCLRICIVNPLTTLDDIRLMIEELEHA
jgi:glutamate/tyrosine decarboxylase-like PLP-dependent enzyme